MDTLDKLFGSGAKVKMMRLFVFNQDQFFDMKTIVNRTRLSSSAARKELSLLLKIGLVKQKGTNSAKRYFLNDAFTYLKPLRELLTHTITTSYDDLIKKIGRTCKLKSMVLSGIFISRPDSRVDMLIIGNQFNRITLGKCMKKIEAEIGKELNYVILETEDFKYRVGVGDRLVRDIFESPHQVAFDRIGLQNSQKVL